MKDSGTTATLGPLRSIPVPARYPMVSFAAIMVALYGLTTPNPLESIWTCGLLLLLLRWFWWSEQPGILLFCMLMPFLEIHTPLLEANQSGVTMDQLFFGTGGQTFWMSSTALLTAALGVRTIWSLNRNGRVSIPIERLKQAADTIDQRKLILGFFAASFTSQLIDRAIPYSSGLRQLEVYANGISEVMLFVVAVKFMLDRKHVWMVVLIFSYLIAISFYSFFSTWKEPLFVLMVASLTQISIFTWKQLIRLLPILAPAIILVLIWQNVKGEYRQFLNGGQFSQRVVVSQDEALGKFQELASEAIFSENLVSTERLDATYRRVGYLEYFANAVEKVPSTIPHEQGKLIQSNLEFALIPRFLAPNKGRKDDKAKVEKYTDFYFGEYGGSSFSLGHYCEAYIDWGRYGMLIQLFLFGVIGGGLFLIAMARTSALNPLLSLGILWVCMKPWGTFQQDMITMSGQVFWGSICQLIVFFPFYRWINAWIKR